MMYVEDKKNSPETRGQWFDIKVLMKMHSSQKQIYFFSFLFAPFQITFKHLPLYPAAGATQVIYPQSLLISPFTLPRSLTGSQLLPCNTSQRIVLQGTAFGCNAMLYFRCRCKCCVSRKKVYITSQDIVQVVRV